MGSFGPFKWNAPGGGLSVSGLTRRTLKGALTGGASEAGGLRLLTDLQTSQTQREINRAQDVINAETMAQQATVEAAERAALERAGRERVSASRRRGRASTILAGGLGLLAPSPGPAGRTLLGA